MNPSGDQTKQDCNGFTTGEPYREVLVYVDGLLAGASPVYPTLFTGGVQPELWSTLVAYTAYVMPTYTVGWHSNSDARLIG